jgi:hypothetical protein
MNINMRLLETQAIRVRLPKSYMSSKKPFLNFFFPFLFIDWNGIVPTNTTIPAGLLQVLKDPFPLPSPAPPPPSDTPYAKAVPHELNALSGLRDMIMASTSHVDDSEVAYEVKKMDPYEEGK